MKDFDFSKIGEQISEKVDGILNSEEVQQVKDSIRNINIQSIVPEFYKSFKKKDLPVTKKPGGKVSGILFLVFGSISAVASGSILLLGGLMYLLTGGFLISGIASEIGAFLLGGWAFASIMVASNGARLSGRVNRFKTYIKMLEKTGYCTFKELASQIGKKESFVVRDLKKMTKIDWFFEGHMDDERTYFMATDELYKQYQESQQALQERLAEQSRMEQSENQRLEQLADNPVEKELADAIEEGRQYIEKLREANDKIKGEEVSQKLERLELISGKIFELIQANPDKLPDIRRFMEYYLPTVLKLVYTYYEFDRQPVQGENIIKGKKEIEETLDEINGAFEKLFDRLFMDDMLDISADISVLSTMLAQEGLTGDEFK